MDTRLVHFGIIMELHATHGVLWSEKLREGDCELENLVMG